MRSRDGSSESLISVGGKASSLTVGVIERSRWYSQYL
jgi:hypothetical protein